MPQSTEKHTAIYVCDQALDFYTRRRTVEENVRRIGVHTEGRRPKTAIVTVDLYSSARSTYLFTGEGGARA